MQSSLNMTERVPYSFRWPHFPRRRFRVPALLRITTLPIDDGCAGLAAWSLGAQRCVRLRLPSRQ